jgi:uncharacterized protein YyaL (SSP411 family)
MAAELDPAVLDRSLAALLQSFDPAWGGFGSAPKFPHALDLRLCLRHWKRTGSEAARAVALVTLDRMAEGGIYDQLAGGFSRYSTDEQWLIPHFEKMLYDNASWSPAYVEAYLSRARSATRGWCGESCAWVRREMTTPEGGFASALDADSEGEEGKFYVWTPASCGRSLGERRGARAAALVRRDGGRQLRARHERASGATPRRPSVARGLGLSVDELARAMEAARALLLKARAERVRPATDDKVLAAWNGS